MSADIQSSTFYIIRHGESEGNVQRILQGQADYPLTEIGKTESLELATKLQKIRFDSIFSSDLLRARQTAEILANERQTAVVTTQLLREQTFGRYDGQPIEKFKTELQELLTAHARLSVEERFSNKIREDIESDEEMVGRFFTFLRETAISHVGKNVLVISHGAMMRTLLIHLGFGTYDELPPNSIQNLGYFVLDSEGVDFSVRETYGIHKQKKENRSDT
jgi:broad specificity phosphatase PhoE